MSGFPGASSAFKKVISTGAAGLAKQNATPTFFTYNVPNDGNLHDIMGFGQLAIASSETGGNVQFYRNGTALLNMFNGGQGGPGNVGMSPITYTAQPGETITIQQTSALTVGASTMYFEFWST